VNKSLSHISDLKEKIKDFPKSPGVYLMKDSKGKIIYVGKAKNLKSRVNQYVNFSDKRYQIKFLMERVRQIDFLITASEKEALILENSLIKKHKPRYNVFLKDDKTFIGLKLTVQDDFPRLLETRKYRTDKSKYYGPFTDGYGMRDVKNFIYQNFQLRTCSDHEFNSRERPCLEYQIGRCSAPCVGYVDQKTYAQQTETIHHFLSGKDKELQKSLKSEMKRLSDNEEFEEAGKIKKLLDNIDGLLERQHVAALKSDVMDVIVTKRENKRLGVATLMVRNFQLIDSRYQFFENLGDDDDFLESFILQSYPEGSFIPKTILSDQKMEGQEALIDILSERAGFQVNVENPQRGEKLKLIKLAHENLITHLSKDKSETESFENALEELQDKLHLKNIPVTMECFDISNISGKNAVGSMVRFENGKPDKSFYKKFKIQELDTPDDFAMMHQVLSRRFSKSTDGWEHPHLLVVDGGKGQLSQAIKIVNDLSLKNIDIIGIAKGSGQGARAKGLWEGKKEDEIYLPGRKNPVILKRGSLALQILQNLRDESHRFAITYHRKLREKTMTKSWLDDIPGIGPSKKRALLKEFGSLEKIANASLEELGNIKGVTKELAERIKSPLLQKR
jgi:excinuclease ABC subunit C